MQRQLNNPPTLGLLGVSFLFPLYQGLIYYPLGRTIPLLIPFSFVLIILLTWMVAWKRICQYGIRFWAIYLLLWSGVRFALPLLLTFSPSVTESHIRDQFTLFYFLISLIYLVLGWKLLRQPGFK